MLTLRRAVKCPDCRRVYSGPPRRYSVDGESRVYFMCECGGRELVGEMRLRTKEAQPILTDPWPVGPSPEPFELR
jgi:hypothetical protein